MLSNDGPCAQAMEAAFASYSGCAGTVLALASGDIALTLAVASLELAPGTRVALASFAHASTLNAVRWNGLAPYFIDVDADDWCVHPEHLEGAPPVGLVLATHMFGCPCDLAGLEELAAARGARLVLDAAPAVASRVGERHVVDYGDASAISFSGTKVATAAEGRSRSSRTTAWPRACGGCATTASTATERAPHEGSTGRSPS